MLCSIRTKLSSIFHRDPAGDATRTIEVARARAARESLLPLPTPHQLFDDVPFTRRTDGPKQAPPPPPVPAQRSGFASWLGHVAGSARTHVIAAVVGAAFFMTSAIAAPPAVPPEVELGTKGSALVEERYGGDYKAAFDHYAKGDGIVDGDELSTFLADAKVGNLLTRGVWVSGVLDRFDRNGDRQIDWPEFEKARDEMTGAQSTAR